MNNKVPQVTVAFWIIKIAATTLGETGGDALSMTLDLGYAISTAIFFGFFVVTGAAQIASSKLHRFLYWAVIVATTTVGTTTSDYLTRDAGLGYLKTSLLLFAMVLGVLGALAFHPGLGERQPHHKSQSGDVLLVGDSGFEHARDCVGRLPGRHFRLRL